MALESISSVTGVFAAAFRNRKLMRLELAWAAFNGVEWGAWIGLLVYAYVRGGAAATSIIVVVQLVPCIVLAPLLGALPDRYRAGRILFFAYAAMTVATAALAVAMAFGAPIWVVYVLAPLMCLSITVPRPAQSALLPAVVRTPAELTAANVVSSWMENASVMIAPALTGLLLGIGGPELALGVLAAFGFAGAALVMTIPGPAPLAAADGAAGEEAGAGSIVAEVRDGIRSVSREPGGRLLVGVLGSQYILVGALDVLYVVLAISVLGIGEAGSGYLNSAFGVGGLIGAALTALLVARRRLAPALVSGMIVAALALGMLGLYPTVLSAFLLLGLAGLSRSVLDVTGRILLQRTVSPTVLAKVFGLLECLMDIGLLIGAVLVPTLVGLSGAPAALLGLAGLFLLIVAVAFRGLWTVDKHATVPLVEINLLRSIPLFAPLPAPALEGLARALEPAHAAAGTTVMTEGEPGDRYYAVASGQVEVTHAGRHVAFLERGEGFGEIALLHDVPRTATVTAVEDTDLYGLEKEPFIVTLTGHKPSAERASSVVSRRLTELGEAEQAEGAG